MAAPGQSSEQSRLNLVIFGFVEIAESDAHQAKTLLRAQIYLLTQH